MPSKLNISSEMKKNLGRFDWAALKAHLSALTREKLSEEIELVLDVMLRDGYLILQRMDLVRSALRNSFMAEFRIFASERGLENLFSTREGRLKESQLTEHVYQQILVSVRSEVLAKIAPNELVWAIFRESEELTRELIGVLRFPRIEVDILDPVAGKVTIPSLGGEVNPDEYSNSNMRTLTATLKMIAYEEDWFDADGVICLPKPSFTQELPAEVLDANHYLAETWNQVERSDGRCRYFEGIVKETANSNKNQTDGSRIVSFEFPDAGEIGLHIAGERLMRLFMRLQQKSDSIPEIQAKVGLNDYVPLPPDGYVSIKEVLGTLALSELLSKWIGDVKKQYRGLTIVEWLRGYSLLQVIGTEHLEKASRKLFALYTPRFLEEMLGRAGLQKDKCAAFIQLVTFAKDAVDVFDAPLIRCGDGNFVLVSSAVACCNLAYVVMSRLASLKCNLSWKGKSFEADILDLFLERDIPTATMDRKINGEQCEVDCLILWEEILFVMECKNHSLPGESAQSEYWFLVEQEEAARQAKVKAEVLSRNPTVVAEVLGVKPKWVKVVPVVINGAPYSRPGPIDGVYFYDASALRKFLFEGRIVITIGDQIVKGMTRDLWSGDQPNANDLLRQLTNPEQEAVLREYFARTELEFPVSEKLTIRTTSIKRLPTPFGIMSVDPNENAQP